MEIKQITIKQNDLDLEMEVFSTGNVDITIRKTKEIDEPYEKAFCSFRSDEIDINELIKILEIARDYNFIQGE